MDTTATGKVAPNYDKLPQGELLRLGTRSANAYIKQLVTLSELLATFSSRGSDYLRNPFSNVIDAIFEQCHSELPDIQGHAALTLEGGAALAAAIFGEEVIPEPDDQNMASRARLAFRIAQMMLESGDKYDAFFIACAIAVNRAEGKRVNKEFAKAERKRRKGAK